MAQSFSKAFYNSNIWKQQRTYILRRDLYTCHDCGGLAEEVHHITELTPKNINDMRIALGPDNLMSLCHDCHTRRTKKCCDLPDGFEFDECGQVTPRG